ncbi:DNA-3-methyladenine glycosylase [Sediminivirga luteola]|uniref:Putative 3-methyladenine DNA glycosylase n=1 Tax=Sediminivirga luteola TaxID=1774748 RepID=A0A8J2TVI1_9MICO|nr:DNA-3-methyladenine glycosylase [Sediminivirga luteola]GGA03716.1 putative 3-methyladenine DNA glycosylase [Sediminivirga luteola]
MPEQIGREFFARPILEVAPRVLGGVLRRHEADGDVAIRLTEVEAYDGTIDPASHAYRGRTARNATMFGPPGHLYCYFIYGMHHSLNMVCGPEGAPTGLLIRAGEVVHGEALARQRRERRRTVSSRTRAPMLHAALARGPGCVAQALGVTLDNDGDDLFGPGWSFQPPASASEDVQQGPRVGVSRAADVPWRFWLPGEPSVSAYRAAQPRAGASR